jgi:transcriptional regulator with XRE-family HTH domain
MGLIVTRVRRKIVQMSFFRRLKTARLEKGFSQTELAKQVGVTRNAVSLWENGKSEASMATMRQLAIVLGVSHEWLATGRGEKVLNMLERGLMLRGDVAAGVWLEVHATQEMEMQRVPVAPDPLYPPDSQYALRVRGNSINRVAQDGSILHCIDVLEAGIDVRDGDLVVVEQNRNGLVETTVKRLRKAAGGFELWPESDDPLHQERLIPDGPKDGVQCSIKALVISTTIPIRRN